MNVPFLQDTTFTGLISTKNYGTSQDWSQAYNLVQANSATWSNDTRSLWGSISGTLSAQTDLWQYLSAVGTSNFDIPTLTNYLSTTPVLLSSLNVKGQILSAGVNLFDIFLTSETDSQTLFYIPSSYLLSISNGNTINLSSINNLFGSVSGKYESVYSNIQSNSANWQSTYLTVSTLSASWEESADILPTVTNYLSTNIVLISSLNVTNNLTVIDLISTSQHGTSQNWGAAEQNAKNYSHTNFFPLSGGTISGSVKINNNLTVSGDLTATGTTTFANTIFSVTSALSVVHIGAGPAMWVGNNGNGDIASFYDIDQNVEILHVGGNNGTFPNVGVKTSTPNKDFTVKGELSASSTIYDGAGNSNNWNSSFTTVRSNSANWQSTYSTVYTLSSNWPTNFKVLREQETNLDARSFGMFVKTVSSGQTFTYSNFISGQTITIYLSANHDGYFYHYFPNNTRLSKAGEGNAAITFNGTITRVTIQNIGNQFVGIANVVSTDIRNTENNITLEGVFGFLLQENDFYLLQE